MCSSESSSITKSPTRWNKYKLIVGDPGPGEWTPPPNVDNQDWSDAKTTKNVSDNVEHDDQEISEETNNLEDLEETLPGMNMTSDYVAGANNQNNLGGADQKLLLDKMILDVEHMDSSDNRFVQYAVMYLIKTKKYLDPAFTMNNKATTSVARITEPSDDKEDVDAPKMVQRKVRRRKIRLQRKRQHLEETRRLKAVLRSTHKITDLASVSHLLNSKVKLQLYDVVGMLIGYAT